MWRPVTRSGGIPKPGGMDCHDKVFDWLQGLFSGTIKPTRDGRVCYIRDSGDGPFGDCDWRAPIKPGEAYF